MPEGGISRILIFARNSVQKMPWNTWKRLVQKKKGHWKKQGIFFLPAVNAWLWLTSLKACDWSGNIFGASAGPSSFTKKLAVSSSSTVHGGQHDTKQNVTFELLYCMRHSWLAKCGILCLNQLVLYKLYSCICCWYRGIHSWTVRGLYKHGLYDSMRHRKQKKDACHWAHIMEHGKLCDTWPHGTHRRVRHRAVEPT